MRRTGCCYHPPICCPVGVHVPNTTSSTANTHFSRVLYAWENPGVPIDEVVNDVLRAFHHPAIRDERIQIQREMFETVRSWTRESKHGHEINRLLSSQSVKEGHNHILPAGTKSRSLGGCGHGDGGHGKPAGSLWAKVPTRDMSASPRPSSRPGSSSGAASGYYNQGRPGSSGQSQGYYNQPPASPGFGYHNQPLASPSYHGRGYSSQPPYAQQQPSPGPAPGYWPPQQQPQHQQPPPQGYGPGPGYGPPQPQYGQPQQPPPGGYPGQQGWGGQYHGGYR